ncbi:MAG TPA: copper resistance CopC family protein [Actinoplanes sp.]|nr:copper resistance CopC family protein [Actinoplanes sp.]
MRSRPATHALATVLAVLASVLYAGGPAWAHNELRAAVPAKGAKLKAAPTRVVIAFHQRLNPDRTTVVVTGAADRQPVATGKPSVVGDTVTVRIAAALPNGAYTVAYRVVSRDGHPVQGAYSFTVADPSPPTAAPSRAAAPSPAASQTPAVVVAGEPAGDEGGSSWLVGVAVAALMIIAGFVVLGVSRRRSRQSADSRF